MIIPNNDGSGPSEYSTGRRDGRGRKGGGGRRDGEGIGRKTGGRKGTC